MKQIKLQRVAQDKAFSGRVEQVVGAAGVEEGEEGGVEVAVRPQLRGQLQLGRMDLRITIFSVVSRTERAAAVGGPAPAGEDGMSDEDLLCEWFGCVAMTTMTMRIPQTQTSIPQKSSSNAKNYMSSTTSCLQQRTMMALRGIIVACLQQRTNAGRLIGRPNTPEFLHCPERRKKGAPNPTTQNTDIEDRIASHDRLVSLGAHGQPRGNAVQPRLVHAPADWARGSC